jgi:hypothetical protein
VCVCVCVCEVDSQHQKEANTLLKMGLIIKVTYWIQQDIRSSFWLTEQLCTVMKYPVPPCCSVIIRMNWEIPSNSGYLRLTKFSEIGWEEGEFSFFLSFLFVSSLSLSNQRGKFPLNISHTYIHVCLLFMSSIHIFSIQLKFANRLQFK